MKRRALFTVIAGLALGNGSFIPSVFANVAPGEQAPDFRLTDISGKAHALSSYRGKYVVLEWFNSECPFVQKHYDSGNMQSLQERYGRQGVIWLTINSTNPASSNFRDAGRSKDLAQQWKMKSGALMLDESGKVGRLFGATATPHMWVIEPTGKVIYAGAIDDKASFRVADIAGARNFVAAALDESMAGRKVSVASAPAYGCSVKY